MSTHTSNVSQEKLQYLAELAKELVAVHGKVALSSGREAGYCVDLRRTILHHRSSRLIGSLLREFTADWDYAHVGGLMLSTDPVAASVIYIEGRPIDTFVVHRGAKRHGMQRRVGGPDTMSKEVLVVKDTTAMGNSSLTTVAALRETGAEVVDIATVVDRATGVGEVIKAGGLEYCYLLDLGDLGLA